MAPRAGVAFSERPLLGLHMPLCCRLRFVTRLARPGCRGPAPWCVPLVLLAAVWSHRAAAAEPGRPVPRGAEQDLVAFVESLPLGVQAADIRAQLAWLLAAHPDTRVRDALLAVRFAQTAAPTSDAGRVDRLLALAAADAHLDRWESASHTAQKALALAERCDDPARAAQARHLQQALAVRLLPEAPPEGMLEQPLPPLVMNGPASPGAYRFGLLGYVLLEAHQFDQALLACRQGERLDPQQPLLRLITGFARLSSHDAGGAIEQFQDLAAMRPNDALVHFGLGSALNLKRRETEAASAFRQALQHQPNWADACDALAGVLSSCQSAELRHPAEAVRLARKACAAKGDSRPEFLFTLSLALSAAGDRAAAAETLQQALRVARFQGRDTLAAQIAQRMATELRPQQEASAQAAPPLLELAVAFMRLGYDHEAADIYHRLLRHNPSQTDLQNNFAWLVATRRKILHRHLDDAARLSEASVAAMPRPEYLDTLAAVQAARGDFQSAVATLDRALHLAGDRPQLAVGLQWRRLGYLAQRPYQDPPGSPDAALVLADSARRLHRLGRYHEAVWCYQQALGWKPQWLEAANNLAWLLAAAPDADVRRPAEARRLAEWVCRRSRESDPRYLDTLSVACAAEGQFHQALDAIDQAWRCPAAEKDFQLTKQLEQHRRLYHSGQPYREAPPPQIDLPELADIAAVLRRAGMRDPALALFEEVLHHRPDWHPIANNVAWLLATHPDPARRDPRRAILLAESACRTAKEAPPAYFDTLSVAQAAAGDFDMALRTLDEALRRGPDRTLRTILAMHRQLFRRRQIAVEPPITAQAAENLRLAAKALHELGDTAASLEYYRRAVLIDPEDPETANSFAWLLATRPGASAEDLDEALAVAEGLVAGGEPRIEWLDTLAAVHAARGEFQRAIEVALGGMRLAMDTGQKRAAVVLDARIQRYQNGQAWQEGIELPAAP